GVRVIKRKASFMATVPEQSKQNTAMNDTSFVLLLVMVFLGMFGVFMLLFSATYIQDLETLTSVPDILWDFTCGRPNAYGATLPLLLTLSLVCFLAVGVIQLYRRRLIKRDHG